MSLCLVFKVVPKLGLQNIILWKQIWQIWEEVANIFINISKFQMEHSLRLVTGTFFAEIMEMLSN